MIIVTGTVKVETLEEVERVKDVLNRRAARSRGDDGCLDYVFAQSLEDPTEIRVIEKWEDEEKLNAHLAIPDEEFNNLLATLKLTSAVVVANETASERELLKR